MPSLAYRINIIQMLVPQETRVLMSFSSNYYEFEYIREEVFVVVRMLQNLCHWKDIHFQNSTSPIVCSFFNWSYFWIDNVVVCTNEFDENSNEQQVRLFLFMDNCCHFWAVYWILICVRNKKLPKLWRRMFSFSPLMNWMHIKFHWIQPLSFIRTFSTEFERSLLPTSNNGIMKKN